MDTRALGMAMVSIGAGRRLTTDQIDHGLGLTRVMGVGAYVQAGEPLAMAHTRDQAQLSLLTQALQQAVTVSEQPPATQPLVYKTVKTQGVTA
jgi:thymidine phosphorylase